jgi:hypothetical protein
MQAEAPGLFQDFQPLRGRLLGTEHHKVRALSPPVPATPNLLPRRSHPIRVAQLVIASRRALGDVAQQTGA